MGNRLRLSTATTPKGRAGREAPAQVFSSRVEDPLAWGWRSRPRAAGLTTLRSKV